MPLTYRAVHAKMLLDHAQERVLLVVGAYPLVVGDDFLTHVPNKWKFAILRAHV